MGWLRFDKRARIVAERDWALRCAACQMPHCPVAVAKPSLPGDALDRNTYVTDNRG